MLQEMLRNFWSAPRKARFKANACSWVDYSSFSSFVLVVVLEFSNPRTRTTTRTN